MGSFYIIFLQLLVNPQLIKMLTKNKLEQNFIRVRMKGEARRYTLLPWASSMLCPQNSPVRQVLMYLFYRNKDT